MWRALLVVGIFVCASSASRATTHAAAPEATLFSEEAYRFPYGGTHQPTIRIHAGFLCDIVLQDGEKIHDVFISDSVRWKVSIGWSGPDVSHVVLKPTRPNLRAALTIMTDRRTYHIALVSTRDAGADLVSFFYPPAPATDRARTDAQTPAPTQTTPPQYSCTGLDSSYTASGAASLRPSSVCNDGKRTYMNMPELTADLPILKATGADGMDVPVNYRFDNAHNAYTVDGTPERLVLIRGGDRLVVTRVDSASATSADMGRKR